MIRGRLHFYSLKGMLLSKALTCMNFFLYKQKYIMETDTFGYIVV